MRLNYKKILSILLLTTFCTVAFAQKEKKRLAQVRVNDKCGFIDSSGSEVIPPIYDDAGSWGNNLVPVNIGKYTPGPVSVLMAPVDPGRTSPTDSINGKEKYIDITVKKEENGKWGYCNASGALVIPVQFTNTTFFNEGMAGVEINGKWGFIDTRGKTVVQPVYDTVGYFSQGLAAVAKNGSYGYINLKGEEVIKLQYTHADAFEKGYAKVFEKYTSDNNGKKSIGRIIDLKGKAVTDAKYDVETNFSNGLISFSLAASKPEDSFIYGLITIMGQVITPPVYREILNFSDGLARVMVYKRHEFYDEFVPHYGYIDTRGREVVKPNLAKAESLNYGMAVVARFDKKDDGESEHALINAKGEQVLGFNWKSLIILDSRHLLANSIKNPYENVIINPNGKKLLSLGGNGFRSLGNGLFTIVNVEEESTAFIGLDKRPAIDFSKNKKRKFISYQFGLIRYTDLDGNYDESGKIKLGLMDLKGNVLVKPKYNEIMDFEPTV